MQTTDPSQCMVCGKNGSSTAGPCHRCLPGLWERFDIEVWSGCLAFDCTPICNVRGGHESHQHSPALGRRNHIRCARQWHRCRANLVDCVTKSDSPWFFGPYGFVLEDVSPLPFVRMKGELGIFEVSENVCAA